MLKQLWATGILVAFSVFGIKAGLGLGAQLIDRGVSAHKKVLFVAGSLFIYFLLFSCMYYVATRFELSSLADRLVHFVQYGMLLHLAAAAGLFAWGLKLLLQNPRARENPGVGASALMVIPCPVCATVILLNLTLAYSIFSLSPLSTTFILFCLFCIIIIITSGAVFLLRRRTGPAHSFLGLAMTAASLYFLFTVLTAPIYPEIKAAFAMSVSNSPANRIDPAPMYILAGAVFVLGGAGFIGACFRKGVKK